MTHKYVFSNCNKKGLRGPTQSEANEFYKNSNVQVSVLETGIQKWKVPFTGTYYIEATGASGGPSACTGIAGKGAKISSVFDLIKNDFLYILVGQAGKNHSSHWGCGGGGATFVAKKVSRSKYFFPFDNHFIEPLIFGAGAGGSADCDGEGIK